ncbi:hypothetical protein GCU67_04725 [Modestobacter muralis]|uniref:Uncharacterized protein n=1 Tax=Modestobacter muralis TaxID=1608614 RepID=A0A6P0H698_9ACTN|nr:hypothetical protein [Modestobacter muralis]NEK93479.1 hypothetical protein [Modestobacter muralis]NEN50246.1 hypothetical protein [Modestobacter muralis]
MRVEPFEETATASDQADWLEANLLCGGTNTVSSASLARVLGLVEDFTPHRTFFDEETDESLDEEILDPERDQLLERVWTELSYRAEVMGDSYPFELKARGEDFTLSVAAATTAGVQSGRNCYVACLMIALCRQSIVMQAAVGDELPELKRASDRIMQILSFKAAAHFIGGDAYWFGWPRIDSAKSYTAALQTIVDSLGFGKLRQAAPAWASGAEKDGTVDVVAWRSFPDKSYGSLVMYGQVASGKNWRGKSITTHIDGYFHEWFEDIPAKHWVPAMFMPFTLHATAGSTKTHSREEVMRGMARRDERDFGIIFDRLRVTSLNAVDEASVCPADALHMHTHDELIGELAAWTKHIREYAAK